MRIVRATWFGSPEAPDSVAALFSVGLLAFVLVAGIVPGFLAVAAIVVARLDRDELAHPATDVPGEGLVRVHAERTERR